MFRNASRWTFLGLLFLLYITASRVIYSVTDVFYTQHCNLGFNGAGIRTLTCTTDDPQTGIVSTGVSFAQFSKPVTSVFRVQVTVSYAVDPTSTFSIYINYQNPVAGMNLREEWRFDPLINNPNNVVRSVFKTIDVRTTSVFSGGTADLISIPFTSFTCIQAPLGFSDPLVNLQFQIFTTLSNPNLNVQLRAQPKNNVEKFGGFAILFNPAQIPLQTAKGFHIGYTQYSYFIGGPTDTLDLATAAHDFGPGFKRKCFLGTDHFKFLGQYTFEYVFGWTPATNYSIYKEVRNTLAQQWGHVFCFGNNTQCSDDVTHMDLIDGNCYTASTCPLPVFTGWTVAGICPSCIQIVCQTCQVTDRSSCSLCKAGTNTHLSGTTCVCDANFIPVTQAIDTASSGLWNNLTPSLMSCKLNCSAAIAGCFQNDCANSTYCTVCDTASNYVLVIISPSQQTCKLCNVQITDCTTCTDQNFCATCDDGYYLNNVLSGGTIVGKNCPACSTVLTNCIKCSDSSTCTLCNSGYKLNTSTKKCDCDPTYNSLPYCLTCTTPTQCSSCTTNAYFLNSTTLQCQPCPGIHSSCLTCSSELLCTSCSTNYVVFTLSPTQKTCKLCSIQILNCTTCTDQKYCATCDVGYYIKPVLSSGTTVGKICEICSIPLSNCLKCSDSVTCTECALGYNLNPTTHKCVCDVSYNSLQYCQTCLIPTQCSLCYPTLYYLNSTTSLCQLCHGIHSECQTCSNEKTCTTCSNTFIPDPVTLLAQGITTCAPCGQFIPKCTECSSTSFCTNCDLFYGLNSVNTCTKCDTLLMSGCEQCESTAACLKCDQYTRLLFGVCHYCNEILHCADCIVNGVPQLECTVCEVGYYLGVSPINSKKQCKSCQNVVSYCKTCSDANTCTSCQYPYLLGPTGICDQCERGYQFYGGICMKLAGCLQTMIKNGKQICIACAIHLHYVLDQTTMTCKCAYGYEQFHEINKLMKCYSRCGDGILVMGQEQCDDGNVIKLDGCSDICQVEGNFECSTQSPSKCILKHDIQGFKFNYALRTMPQNKARLSFSIQPSIQAFKKMDFSKLIKLEFASQTSVKQQQLRFSYSYDSNEIFIQFPYYEQLQSTILSTTLQIDPEVIISTKRFFFLASLLFGKNSPLILQSQETIATHGNISTISFVLIILLLLQFFFGSYTHKMIGLQTIQTIQLFYFIRMIASSSSTSLLQAMNTISYSAAGYQNAQIIFGQQYLEILKSQTYHQVEKSFQSVDLDKYFLANVNFFLILIPFVVLAYVIRLKQKIGKRQSYLETKQKQLIAEYTNLKRSSQWIYDHLVFPLIIMLNMISFFCAILTTSSHPSLQAQPQTPSTIQLASFISHIFLLFSTISIYCYEIFLSYEGFMEYRMTQKQRQRRQQTQVEKLENDNNSPDRPNYHPLYVLVYLLYYLIIQIALVFGTLFNSFAYKIQLSLAVCTLYFILIIIWKPYHPIVNKHNYFLYLNHGSVVVFLGICLVFSYDLNFSPSINIYIMYFIMVLLSIIMIGGFVRIFIEKNFRRNLQRDSSLLQIVIEEDSVEKKNNSKEKLKDSAATPSTPLPKNFGLILNNQYVFQNQMKDLSIKYGIRKAIVNELKQHKIIQQIKNPTPKNQPKTPHPTNLTKNQEQLIISKIRYQYKQLLKQQNENPFSRLQNYTLLNQEELSPTPHLMQGPQNNFDYPVEQLLQIRPEQYLNSQARKSDYDKFKDAEEKKLMQKLIEEDQQRLLRLKKKLRQQLKALFV